ncbi:MAG: TMEM165/GDT1 family protein [Leptospiraceae bacterium]|nr:TMEM165/GDT1 family protein [Leptospiraceae bacterium]MDW7974969.1 TMEM165/GDT1 family protein [Leptospiraceae bacterium]
MDVKTFLLVFGTIFLAEIGDKTQLATLLYATDKNVNPWIVFLGASLALILTTAIGTFLGSLVSQYISPKYLKFVAGILFILVGIWTILSK